MSVRGDALALLGRRDHTIAELRDKLLGRGHDAHDVDVVVVALIEDRTLDDGRVAAAHVRVASQIKSRGRLRIRQELMARGVEKRVIEEALAGLPEEDESAAITKFLERKRYPDNPTALERQKVFLQLLRKGFSSAAISRMLKPKGAKRG